MAAEFGMVPIKELEMSVKFSRTRIAALGASALLILGGASVAFAQNPQAQPSQAAPEPAVEEPAGPDTDNIQEGDQNGPDEAGGVEEDAGGPDTDLVEDGDQTSPDASTQSAPAAQAASSVVASKAGSANALAAAPKAETALESESAPESESAAEADGPGGHEDADGEIVDHQFEGEE